MLTRLVFVVFFVQGWILILRVDGLARGGGSVRSSKKKKGVHAPPRKTDEDVLAEYKSRLGRAFTKDEEWSRFVEASARPLRRSVTVTARGDTGMQTKVPWAESGFYVDDDVSKDARHVTGQFYIQEAASMLPVAALFDGFHDIRNNTNFLAVDACAAPGGKSIQLTSSIHGITLIANEISSSRLASLAHNVQRCGTADNTVLTHGDAGHLLDSLQGLCDFVLIDAPCSGDTQSRRLNTSLASHLRSAPNAQDTERLVKEQKRLLRAAVDAVKPGTGRIVYSTCSLDPAENEDVVTAILHERSDLVLFPPPTAFSFFDDNPLLPGTVRLWPHDIHDTAGFFCARFKRCHDAMHTVSANLSKHTKAKTPSSPLSIFKASACVTQYFQSTFDIPDFLTATPKHKLVFRGADLWLLPPTVPPALLPRLNRPGLKLLQAFGNKPTSDNELEAAIKSGKVRPTHEFALTFGHLSTCPLILHDPDHILSYLQGDDLFLDDSSLSLVSIQQQHKDQASTLIISAAKPRLHPDRDIILGLAKLIPLPGNKKNQAKTATTMLRRYQLKNQLPRDLVRRDLTLVSYKK